MLKKLLPVCLTAALSIPSEAIIWKYGNFNTDKKMCRVTGWSGTEPTSGKLTVPSTYQHTDGVTYTVVTIDDHALDNLQTVKEIVIPATIKTIGSASYDGNYASPCNNFYNCPNLEKITVNSANENFTTVNGGILCHLGGSTESIAVLKVPQKLSVTSGNLDMDEKVHYLCKDAFTGNTTVTKLKLSRRTDIIHNAGLNNTTSLAKITLATTTNYSDNLTMSGEGLILNGNELVCFPPAANVTTYTVPSTAKTIGEYAFANTQFLQSVKMTSTEEIGEDAFKNSSITSATIQGTVKSIGQSAFAYCKRLKTLKFETVNAGLPKGFARDCSSLTSVTASSTFKSLGQAAFVNCSALTSFPFNGKTDMSADSIFYGCGFSQVVYEKSPTGGDWYGEDIVSACRNLTLIDASAITGTYSNYFTLGESYAANCMKLTTVKFPEFMGFSHLTSHANIPAFGYYCVLDHIEFGSFTNGGAAQFCYSSTTTTRNFEPDVFIKATANSQYTSVEDKYNSWPLYDLFSAANGATISPHIFCDPYTPSKNYVVKGATYYIPGGTTANYSEAKSMGCTVEEMFGIQIGAGSNGNLKVKIDVPSAGIAGKNITNVKAAVDGGTPVTINSLGEVQFSKAPSAINTVTVTYEIDGVAMMTNYPSDFWKTSGIDGVNTDEAPLKISRQADTLIIAGGDGNPLWQIISASGCTVMSGRGTAVDLSSLAPGIYIVCAADSTTAITKKITL